MAKKDEFKGMWVSECVGLTSHSTHNRSFRGRFLQARWPNQQGMWNDMSKETAVEPRQNNKMRHKHYCSKCPLSTAHKTPRLFHAAWANSVQPQHYRYQYKYAISNWVLQAYSYILQQIMVHVMTFCCILSRAKSPLINTTHFPYFYRSLSNSVTFPGFPPESSDQWKQAVQGECYESASIWNS